MQVKLNITPSLRPFAEAVTTAAKMQAFEDEGWTYRATNPDGKQGPLSAIEILDETGERVGFA